MRARIVPAAIIVLILGSAPALAQGSAARGGMGSGGGAALVCFDSVETARQIGEDGAIPDESLSSITSIEAIDLLYARSSGSVDGSPHPVVETSTHTEKEIFEALVNRVFHSFPAFGSAIREMYQRLTENLTMRNFPIPRRDDLGDVVRYQTGKCVVATLALQATQDDVKNFFPVPLSLDIDERLFLHPKHSALSRAAILLHESVYGIARENGEETSRTTRLVLRDLLSAGGTPLSDILDRLVKYRFLPNFFDTGIFYAPTDAVFNVFRDYISVGMDFVIEPSGSRLPRPGKATADLAARLESIADKYREPIDANGFDRLAVPDSERKALSRVARSAYHLLVERLKGPQRAEAFALLQDSSVTLIETSDLKAQNTIIELISTAFYEAGGAEGVVDVSRLTLEPISL